MTDSRFLVDAVCLLEHLLPAGEATLLPARKRLPPVRSDSGLLDGGATQDDTLIEEQLQVLQTPCE